jgi:hypothetical protein
MNTNRKNARWAGIFYIIATAAPIATIFFVGFLGGGIGGEPMPDYLANVSTSETHMIIGALIEWIWALAVIGIIVTLLPILKLHNETLALGFSSLRFIESISTIIHVITLLTLFTLSQGFVEAGAPESSHFQTIGNVLLAIREWAFIIGSGLVWSLSAIILNYILYKSKLIPQWLSGWGFVGGVLSFANYLPELFGIDSIEILFIPIAVQEMVFAVWLIVKGFNSSTITPESSK